MRRLHAIDSWRGLVVVLMVMHHALDSFVVPPERTGPIWAALRHLGGLPAPGFMLLAGLSAALVLARERDRGLAPRARALAGVRRGLYVLGIAFAFRVFAFVAGGNPLAKWDMIFRVDVLNCMGVALAIVAALCALAPTRRASAAIALVLCLLFALPAPILWGHVFTFPSTLVGNYVTGANRLVLFPLFPWVAFTAAGFAVGEHLAHLTRACADDAALRRALRPYVVGGAALFFGGWALAHAPFTLYPAHDWWKASPLFVAMRIGLQLALFWAAVELVSRLRAESRRLDALQLLGRHSLMAYLVHLELVYGHLANPLKKQLTIAQSLALTLVLVVIVGAIAWWQERREARRARARATPRPAPVLGQSPKLSA